MGEVVKRLEKDGVEEVSPYLCASNPRIRGQLQACRTSRAEHRASVLAMQNDTEEFFTSKKLKAVPFIMKPACIPIGLALECRTPKLSHGITSDSFFWMFTHYTSGEVGVNTSGRN